MTEVIIADFLDCLDVLAAKACPNWTEHNPRLGVRICDGAHESEEGCTGILEAEIIGHSRQEAVANARLAALAPHLPRLARALANYPCAFTAWPQDSPECSDTLAGQREWCERCQVLRDLEEALG